MFEVPIQAAIGSRVIARETVAAIRKNVDRQSGYGGDIIPRERKLPGGSRKRKKAHEARLGARVTFRRKHFSP